MVKKKSRNPSVEEDGPDKKKQKNPEKNEKSKPSAEVLPIDIVATILSRLPAKSVAKFRCVCKRWLSLTHDPHFLKSHHERSPSRIIIGRRVSGGEIELYDFTDVGKPTKSTHGFNLGRKVYMLSNFVDGLTCAYTSTARSDIYLLNPMTLAIQKLPRNNCRLKGFVHETFSLVIDMTVGKYKVVRIFSCPASERFYSEIYDVGTTQWRCLGEAPFEYCDISAPIFLHGALYCLGVARGDNRQSVFRFDIKDEKFGSAISVPILPSSHLDLYCLKECRGKIWLVFNNRTENYFEIWTMKDYLNDTWVKEYVFHASSISKGLVTGYDVTGIVDGEIHFRVYEGGELHLRCYNLCSGALRNLLIRGQRYGNVASYRESLISPKKLFLMM